MQRVICTNVHSIKKSSVPLYTYEVELNTDAIGHEMYVKLWQVKVKTGMCILFG